MTNALQECRRRFRTWVTLVVQYIGNTFGLMVHTFLSGFLSPEGGSTAVPKRGSADLSRSDELQFAAQVVRLGPVLGAPQGGLGGAVHVDSFSIGVVGASLRRKLAVISSY